MYTAAALPSAAPRYDGQMPANRRTVLGAVAAFHLAVPWAARAQSRPVTGFNQNWSMLPALGTPGMVENIRKLKPGMLRYPGGTVTHAWDWRAGAITTRRPLAAHPVANVKRLADATGAAVIVVLDVIHRSIDDQLALLLALQAAGLSISHVELGNEVYARDKGYEQVYPTGASYGAAMAVWMGALRKAFPGVKVGAVLLGREPGAQDARIATWNAGVVPALASLVDAFVFHVYQSERETVEQTMRRFTQVVRAANTGQKELWITEYGSQHPAGSGESVASLAKLAAFVEGFPHVSVALNHQLIGGSMAKLSPDGAQLTPEGEMFAARR
jgi:hypothetical protein